MPSGKHWINFVYVNLAFGLYIAGVFFFSQLQNIKDNWSTYRCNPMYMPLADDVDSNFVYCIQNSMSSFMGFIMQPLTFLTSSMSGMLSGFLNEINMVRAMFDKIRTFISSIIESIFGVFLNLVIEFQKIIIGIKDLIGKSIGIMVTLMYVIDGSVKTMQSAWNGPAGKLVKALGKCFHPETKIKLQNGNTVSIKDINLGDILDNGSIVEATMKLDNKINQIPLYIIKSEGVNRENIYVTGTHLIFDKKSKKYVKVENYVKAEKTEVIIDWFSCLITSDHKIVVGSEKFWDWEDDDVLINQ
jgi:hypothetical protein